MTNCKLNFQLAISFFLLLFLPPFSLQADPPVFSGEQAFSFLVEQVALGPRVPGSEAHGKAVKMFVDRFQGYGGRVRLQRFSVTLPEKPEPGGKTRSVEAVNVIADFGPSGSPTYLFAAHFDTRPWADNDPDLANRSTPIPGANDGASGVAVLLELARLFSQEQPPMTVEIVLFDVEDSGISGDNESYCLGSAYFADNLMGAKPTGAILLDMIGDADLDIPMETFSYINARSWTLYLFELAENLGLKAFRKELGEPVYDDHINLLKIGIPTCDFIDFNYPYWHTLKDLPENCSPESLEQVGRLLRYLVYEQ